MLLIRCVYCGLRDEEEFTFGGPSHVSRPGSHCGNAEWADYLFNRDNPKGVHYERWNHSFGCRRWFNVARDTTTHEILEIYRMGEPKPKLDYNGSCLGPRAYRGSVGSWQGAEADALPGSTAGKSDR